MIIYPDHWHQAFPEAPTATPEAMAAMLDYFAEEVSAAGYQPASDLIAIAAQFIRRAAGEEPDRGNGGDSRP